MDVALSCLLDLGNKGVNRMRLIDADYLKTWFGEKDLYTYDYIIGTIADAPTIEPERKKGKWDFMGWQMFQCSKCKHTFTQDFLEGWREYTYESHFPPFCPNCGSYNGGEQDGSNHTGN